MLFKPHIVVVFCVCVWNFFYFLPIYQIMIFGHVWCVLFSISLLLVSLYGRNIADTA